MSTDAELRTFAFPRTVIPEKLSAKAGWKNRGGIFAVGETRWAAGAVFLRQGDRERRIRGRPKVHARSPARLRYRRRTDADQALLRTWDKPDMRVVQRA